MGLPVEQLTDPPTDWAPEWLTSEFSRKIIHALGSETACFVGGAVRDSLLGLPVADVDLATSHTPERVMKLLCNATIKAIPTGLDHGTITAVLGNQSCEITTLRRDLATDGRHADVEFTEDWHADAARRDFTINALYATPDGQIFDPVDGLSDLKARKVRFIGDAEERIREDALRILRFYRFSARFADSIDEAGQAACVKFVDMIDGLSVERIRDELLKIFALQDIIPTIRLMQESRAMHRIFGHGWQPASVEAYCSNETSLSATINPMVRLYMLTYGLLSAKQLAVKLKLSNQERRFLVTVELAMQQGMFEKNEDIRRSLYLYGGAATMAVSVMHGADDFERAQKLSREWTVPKFPVKGRDLMAMGLEAGPAMGEMLDRLEESWVSSDFSIFKSQLLEMVRPSQNSE